jgi:hypothetical protein
MVSNTTEVTSDLAQVSHTRRRIYILKKFRKQGAGENTWTQERGIDKRMEKTTQ